MIDPVAEQMAVGEGKKRGREEGGSEWVKPTD
jgi:hypothetical protein